MPTEATEVSAAEMGSAAHCATEVRSAHSPAATVPALGQRACGQGRCDQRDRRCSDNYYLTHEGSSPLVMPQCAR